MHSWVLNSTTKTQSYKIFLQVTLLRKTLNQVSIYIYLVIFSKDIPGRSFCHTLMASITEMRKYLQVSLLDEENNLW